MAQLTQNVSAGLLLFRKDDFADLEVFLAHPGGPLWTKRDEGAWTIPKGEPNDGEALLDAARREFEEETGLSLSGPFLPLGHVRQKAGKIVHAWACEGDADPAAVRSNMIRCQWPPRSGRWVDVPEVDRCAWLDRTAARRKINAAQAEFLDRLERVLAQAG